MSESVSQLLCQDLLDALWSGIRDSGHAAPALRHLAFLALWVLTMSVSEAHSERCVGEIRAQLGNRFWRVSHQNASQSCANVDVRVKGRF
jgi:hypothetical protein